MNTRSTTAEPIATAILVTASAAELTDWLREMVAFCE
jgi:hypothetical protein